MIYAVQGDGTRGKAAGSATHADIIANVGFALRSRLTGSPCKVKMSDMRLRVDAVEAGFYPDVLVHCDPVDDPARTDEIHSARLVVEVLSPTTESFDRTKLAACKKLAGLRQTVLVSSTEQAVSFCSRHGDEAPWSPMATLARGSGLAVPALGLQLDWDGLYAGAGIA